MALSALIQAYEKSVVELRKQIEADALELIAKHDRNVSDSFEKILAYEARDESERSEKLRFLLDYLYEATAKTSLHKKVREKILSLLEDSKSAH